MGMRRWLALIVMTGTLASKAAHADVQPSGVQTYSLFLGVDAGFTISQPDETDVENEKSGSHLAGKALFSLATRSAVFDLGVGWMFDDLSGDPKPSNKEDPDHRNVKTRAGFAVIAARMKTAGNLEWGLGSQVLFGTDTTFAPFEEDEDAVANVFLGPQVFYTWTSGKDWMQRAGLEAMTDVTISKRQVSWITLSYAIGFPIMKPVTKVQVREKTVYRDRVVVKERVKIKTETAERYILEPQFVNFETDQFTLSARSQQFLQQLGAYLAQNQGQWEVVQIAGHTDMRGGLEHNQKLSQNRAMTVFNALKQAGVPEERMKVLVMGPKNPVTDTGDAIALAQNRRVEIAFMGQTDVDKIKTYIGRLKQQLNIPETCQSDSACR